MARQIRSDQITEAGQPARRLCARVLEPPARTPRITGPHYRRAAPVVTGRPPARVVRRIRTGKKTRRNEGRCGRGRFCPALAAPAVPRRLDGPSRVEHPILHSASTTPAARGRVAGAPVGHGMHLYIMYHVSISAADVLHHQRRAPMRHAGCSAHNKTAWEVSATSRGARVLQQHRLASGSQVDSKLPLKYR